MKKLWKQIIVTMLLTGVLSSCGASTPAFAAGWAHINNIGWFYDMGENSGGPGSSTTSRYAKNLWLWIPDSADQRILYCYYFGPDGRMYQNQNTPDGYQVDDTGAWIVNGVRQWRLNENYKETPINTKTIDYIPIPYTPPRPKPEPKVYRNTPSIRDEFYPVYYDREEIRRNR